MAGDQDEQAAGSGATTPGASDQASGPSKEAEKVFEKYLGLSTFFKRHQDLILDKLQECYETADKAPRRRRRMIFFAESLPIIDGLIQIGTTRKEYSDALEKVKEELKSWTAQEERDREGRGAAQVASSSKEGQSDVTSTPPAPPPPRTAPPPPPPRPPPYTP